MMNQNFRKFLFSKGVLVSTHISENAFEVLFTMANMFNIKITDGQKYVDDDMIAFASEMLGECVPEPFYRNFPRSVRMLSPDQLLYDQLSHYSVTYGLGNFSEAGYSLFEEEFDRIAFKEKAEIKKFVILNEEEALKLYP